LGNLAAFRSPLGDRALYQTLAQRSDAANGCNGKSFTTRRKNISQSLVNTGYSSRSLAAFDRIMLNPKG
jgi:hypothetical protein